MFRTNRADASKSEILYLKDAMEQGDTTAITHITSIAAAYRSTAAGLAVLPVPTEIAQDDLALINAMAHLGEIAEDFTRVNSDPLATMLALQQYSQAVQNLGNAFIQLNSAYRTAGVTLASGEPGAAFVNLILTVAAKQKAVPTP